MAHSCFRHVISERRVHLVWPTAGFLLLVVLFSLFPLDRQLADWFYKLEGSHWALRDAWLTSTLIHQDGRKMVLAVALFILLMIGLSFPLKSLRPYRRGLSYVLISALLSGLLVNGLKALTHMSCPWDLVRYGGDRVYHGLLDFSAWSQARGNCFPAGHASAAYAWFGLYFFTRHHFPRLRWRALGMVITLGLIFGISQQLRGAHFISHDIWTAWLCWCVATLLSPWLKRTGTAIQAGTQLV